MKYVFLMIGLAFFAFAGFSQQPKQSSAKNTVAKKTPTPLKKAASSGPARKAVPKAPPKLDEKAELEKAMAIEIAETKAAALAKFLEDFPKSESRFTVIESLTSARVAAADAKFEAGEREAAVKFARKAIDEAPVPYSEKLFTESISKVPQMLYTRGEPVAAYEIAAVIEKNSVSNAPQLLSLAGFYLSAENGSEAKRLAETVTKMDERSVAAYQMLGIANRLNFDLTASAAAYEKAVEIEPESVSARQSLAEMKRALGKPDEAIAIFSSLIEKDASDMRSVNGRILSLFDAGKRADAEAEFARAIDAAPGNFVLIAGASYWYAAHNENAKAIELAGKAIAIEPRYIWSHIALARGLSGDSRFMDAEQVLLKARQYGNFPTLDYEIASAKYAAGFYREAADELQKSFTVKDGAVVTKLGRRIERGEKNFTDLLAGERQASILEPKAADNADTAEKLRALLEFRTLLVEKTPDETKLADAAGLFANGSDKMRFHRQIFAASELLERSVAPTKALELSKAAVTSVDDGLNIPSPAAPIMASELYSSRTTAIAADKYVIVPDVPKQTLSAIARGRIEEIAGAALILQKNNSDAAIRLRRAISILPEKSAWWRNSLWRLGIALEAEGKDKEALDAYVKSYTSGDPEALKFATIEGVYKRVNNGTDGLEALIGANPAKPAEKAAEAAVPTETKTEAAQGAKIETSTEVKVPPSEEKKTETAEKPTENVSSPPTTKEAPKVIASPSPLPEPEVKKTVEEKPADQKPIPVEEASPKPSETTQKPEDAKPKPAVEPSPKPSETVQRSENLKPKQTEESSPTKGSVGEKPIVERAPGSKPVSKPLFEPVVIEIKTSKPKDTAPPKREAENSTKTENQAEQAGAARPRVVEGKEIAADIRPSCTISVSQDNISLIGGGGSVGILVGTENGDIKEVKSASSSAKDVEVIAEPEIAGVSGRALFVIRSLTAAAGVYQVMFTSPCGKKEVLVRVR